MPILLLIFALAALTGLARAQTQDDLTLTLTAPSLAIGIDQCASEVDKQIVLSGTLNGSYESYDLRLVYSLTDSACGREVLSSCPSTGGSEGSECGCITETTSSTISKRGALADILAEVGDLCARGTNAVHRVRFYLEYHQEGIAGASDIDERSEPQELRLDFQRPSTPNAAPTVTASEAALELDFEALSDTDIDHYEVCLAPLDEALTPTPEVADAAVTDAGAVAAAPSSNVGLREGFSRCKSAPTGQTSYRFEGLENDATYMVVYAGVDEAGNRGPNSPSAMGTPASVEDFAEVYSAMNGGEPGGCAFNGPARLPALLAPLLLLGLLLVRRS
ncbi:hypothetical protein KKF91_21825 [Myxococcota bacterium]|nr:hypothetical protein [Myxococcota bacterium]MBU1433185.1 hypothetical protein [Myxococcota bacterium]MBU1896190.1 hypothetical protein [Myxococcota bacterium]